MDDYIYRCTLKINENVFDSSYIDTNYIPNFNEKAMLFQTNYSWTVIFNFAKLILKDVRLDSDLC
jgi:hypothetical protein